MANYPIYRRCKNNDTLLGATSSYYSDEYAESMCELFLRDEFHNDDNRKSHRYYRLHAYHPHTIEKALQYEINCPNCSTGMLKQVGRCKNSHELGLYVCPVCEKSRRRH